MIEKVGGKYPSRKQRIKNEAAELAKTPIPFNILIYLAAWRDWLVVGETSAQPPAQQSSLPD